MPRTPGARTAPVQHKVRPTASRANEPISRFLTLDEFASLAGLAVDTLKGYRRERRAAQYGVPEPAAHVGHVPLWHIEDAAGWIKSRTS